MRRDLAAPDDLCAQLLEATARHSSKHVPGFVVLLAAPERRIIRRILAVVDHSDGRASGLLALAAVAAADQTGAAVDVLVIGAEDEALDTSATGEQLMQITRDRDLFEQAKRRSASLGARGHWMFIDHVDDPGQLVRDVLAAQEYDLVVDDLGDVNLGGRMGRRKRVSKALRADGRGGILMTVLEKSDLPVLLVLDAVRLGLIPPKVKAGAGASVLVLGILVSAAPKAAAGPMQREQAQTSISQTVDDYDAALTAAANSASANEVQESQELAQGSADEALAAVPGQDDDSTAATTDESGEQQSDDQASQDQSDSQASEDQQADDQTSEDESAAVSDDTAAQEQAVTDTSATEDSPESVTPAEAPDADSDDVTAPDDVSQADVDEVDQAAADSQAALDQAEQDFDEAQQAAAEASDAADEASADAVEAGSDLDVANAAYEQVTDETDDVISDATGISGVVPGGATAEDMAAAESQQADALNALNAAGQQADVALTTYEEAADEAEQAMADLESAASAVTDAQTQYNQDQATADAYDEAYQHEMADARVTPVAEGEYTPSAHYGDAGPMWSLGYHTGEDYAAPIGTEVDAAASGTVVEVKHDDPSYGNRVVIEHEDGYYTTYNHLSQIDVTEGQQVTAGQKIGEVGDTGNVSGPHLHFEVTQGGDGWSSGSFVDPTAWLAGEVG